LYEPNCCDNLLHSVINICCNNLLYCIVYVNLCNKLNYCNTLLYIIYNINNGNNKKLMMNRRERITGEREGMRKRNKQEVMRRTETLHDCVTTLIPYC